MTTTTMYTYPSPVKSDPETESDEFQAKVRINKQTIIHQSDQARKVKSSLCRNFITNGFCPYGKRCQFAHGPEQLRCNQSINTSYKTKPCFSFLKQGHCPYGYRCNFVHQQNKQSNKFQLSKVIQNFPQLITLIGGAQKSRLINKFQNRYN